MFQVIFNELSAAEISALPKSLQLELLSEFHVIPEDLDHLDQKKFGVIEREGEEAVVRYRAKDYRIYFDKRPEGDHDSCVFCTRTRCQETSCIAAS